MTATITLKDDGDGFVSLFHFENGFNDESRAHVIAQLLGRHLETIAQKMGDETPVDLVNKDGHLEIC
jgi:hypothetical protein